MPGEPTGLGGALVLLGVMLLVWIGFAPSAGNTAGPIVGLVCFVVSPAMGIAIMAAKARSALIGFWVGIFLPILGPLILATLESKRG